MVASYDGKLDERQVFRLRPSKATHDDPGPADGPSSSRKSRSRRSTGDNPKKRKRLMEEEPASTQTSPVRVTRSKKQRKDVVPDEEVEGSAPPTAKGEAQSSRPKARKYTGTQGADIFAPNFNNRDSRMVQTGKAIQSDDPVEAVDEGLGGMDIDIDTNMNAGEDDLPGVADIFHPHDVAVISSSKQPRRHWGPRAGLKHLPTDDEDSDEEQAEDNEPVVTSGRQKNSRRPPSRVPSSESDGEGLDSAPSASKARAPGPSNKASPSLTVTSKAGPKPRSNPLASIAGGTANLGSSSAKLPTQTQTVAKNVANERAVACYLIHPQFMPRERDQNPASKLSKEEVRVFVRSRSDDISHYPPF